MIKRINKLIIENNRKVFEVLENSSLTNNDKILSHKYIIEIDGNEIVFDNKENSNKFMETINSFLDSTTTKSFTDVKTTTLFFKTDMNYDAFKWFNNGFARVKKNGKYSYINTYGIEIVPYIYENGSDFQNGVAKVQRQEKIGYINSEGKEFISCKYEAVKCLGEDMFAGRLGGYWAYINKEGEEITSFKYHAVNKFNNGLSKTEKFDKVAHKFIYGLINKEGKEIIPCIYDKVDDFHEALAVVRKNGKWGFINTKGEEVIPFEYDSVYNFHEGLAIVQKNGKWGFIDKKGEEVIPFEYDSVSNFHESTAVVSKGEKKGFVNKNCEEVISCNYVSASNFQEGLAAVKKDEDGKYGYINKRGEEVLPYKYRTAYYFKNGFAIVSIAGKDCLINKKGKILLRYDGIRENSDGTFSLGMLASRLNKDSTQTSLNHPFLYLYGRANMQCNKIVLPIQYEYIGDFRNGIALVKKNGRIYYIKENGEPLTPKVTITKMEDLLTLPKNCCIEHAEIKYGLDFQGNIVTFDTVEQREEFINLLDNTINNYDEDTYSKKLCKRLGN